MTGRLKTRSRCRRQTLRVSGLSVGVILPVLVVATAGYGGLRINMTPSAPLGLWRIIPPERPVRPGDLVFVCPPLTAVLREGLSRGYLRRGACAGGVAPLIKTVAGMPGQLVTISGVVRIDGELLAHSRVLPFDGKGRPLFPHAGGRVPPGQVHVHSKFPGSFDSRYFGPLPIMNILGLAQEVWTRDP